MKKTLLQIMTLALTLAITGCPSSRKNSPRILERKISKAKQEEKQRLEKNPKGAAEEFLEVLQEDEIDEERFSTSLQSAIADLEKAEKTCNLLKIALEEEIQIELKYLQWINHGLLTIIKENKGVAGVGKIKSFITYLRKYVPRKRKYHEDSEGYSESYNPKIVYRALNKEDIKNLQSGSGISSKGKNNNFNIREHVSPLKGQQSNRDQSPFISTTRSLKVAAAWASESEQKLIATVRIDSIDGEKYYDFTQQPEDLNSFFGPKSMGRSTVLASQEVIIQNNIPQKNIIGFYTADTLSETEYNELKDKSREELTKQGIHSVVKTRKLAKENPEPRILKYSDLISTVGEEVSKKIPKHIGKASKSISPGVNISSRSASKGQKGGNTKVKKNKSESSEFSTSPGRTSKDQIESTRAKRLTKSSSVRNAGKEKNTRNNNINVSPKSASKGQKGENTKIKKNKSESSSESSDFGKSAKNKLSNTQGNSKKKSERHNSLSRSRESSKTQGRNRSNTN